MIPEVAAVDGQTAVQPGTPFGIKMENGVQAKGNRLAALGLPEYRRRDLAGADCRKPVDADLLDGDVLAREAESPQRQRSRRIAFRARAADADDVPLEVRHSLNVRRGEHRRADDVAERPDTTEVTAPRCVGTHHRGHPDMHQMDATSLERGSGFAASDHTDDFELQSLSLIESCDLCHPDGEEGIGRSCLAEPEGRELRGSSRGPRTKEADRG